MAGDPDERIVGIDEAGRGSLVGPLVVGAFVTTRSSAASLPGIGVRDSKLLSPTARASLFAELARRGRRLTVTVPPEEIDRHVPHGRLNELEAAAFARLVRRAGATTAYVDACDPVAARFGRRVAVLSGGSTRIVAAHRADRDVPVVGAGSIVAKVVRDRAVAGLRATLGDELGSGYPSDRKTVAFVRSHLAAGGPTPSWLRASWSTTQRLSPPTPARTLEAFGP